MKLTVYVPKDGVVVPGLTHSKLQRGAALVAQPQHGTLELAVCEHVTQPGHRDFCFADRVREAAALPLRKPGRSQAVKSHPVKADDYLEVALWDDQRGEVVLLPGRERELARWLGGQPYRNDLEASDSQHHQQQDARQRARRAFLSGRPDEGMRIMHKNGLRGW